MEENSTILPPSPTPRAFVRGGAEPVLRSSSLVVWIVCQLSALVWMICSSEEPAQGREAQTGRQWQQCGGGKWFDWCWLGSEVFFVLCTHQSRRSVGGVGVPLLPRRNCDRLRLMIDHHRIIITSRLDAYSAQRKARKSRPRSACHRCHTSHINRTAANESSQAHLRRTPSPCTQPHQRSRSRAQRRRDPDSRARAAHGAAWSDLTLSDSCSLNHPSPPPIPPEWTAAKPACNALRPPPLHSHIPLKAACPSPPCAVRRSCSCTNRPAKHTYPIALPLPSGDPMSQVNRKSAEALGLFDLGLLACSSHTTALAL